MSRLNFDYALQELREDILKMGNLVQVAIDRAVQSLARQDLILAQEVIDRDSIIDDFELEIEDKCMKLIATQQPIAKDLRKIGAGLKIIQDLERMGDYAVDIARVTIRIGNQPLIKPLVDIPKMAKLAQEMVEKCLVAYVREDVQSALELGLADHEIDSLCAQVFNDVLSIMIRDPRTINQGTYLLFVARYLERVADHATNIAEELIYLVTGERRDLND